MNSDFEIVTVDAANVGEYGFFCYKSKPKSEGYRQKLDWLRPRFSEGLRIQILFEDGRSVGFIEYMPGESTWRAVHAPGYLLVHCLWVVGRAKKKGYGSRLLERCVEDARRMRKHGVAMVTSSRNWLAGSKLLLKNGFEVVDHAPPTFELLVKKLGEFPSPAFPGDWDERLSRCGPGLTIVRSSQCPYVEAAVQAAVKAADDLGIGARVIELGSGQEARDLAPSAYGTYNVVYDGKLLTYHSVGRRDLLRLLDKNAKL
jgi:GNAT superfamily N-acetyltransferase